MKDDGEKVELTFGDVRRAAESCPDAKRVLERLVPKVFAPVEEWEDVSDQVSVKPRFVGAGPNEVATLVGNDFNIPLVVVLNPLYGGRYKYKIENGRAYRLKA